MRLLAPFVPHVAEAVWQDLFAAHEGSPSVGRAPVAGAAGRLGRRGGGGRGHGGRGAAHGGPALALGEQGLAGRAAAGGGPARGPRDVGERSAAMRDDVRAAARIERLDVVTDEAVAAGTAAVERARTT